MNAAFSFSNALYSMIYFFHNNWDNPSAINNEGSICYCLCHALLMDVYCVFFVHNNNCHGTSAKTTKVYSRNRNSHRRCCSLQDWKVYCLPGICWWTQGQLCNLVCLKTIKLEAKYKAADGKYCNHLIVSAKSEAGYCNRKEGRNPSPSCGNLLVCNVFFLNWVLSLELTWHVIQCYL